MIRAVLGFVVAAAVWFPAFFTLARLGFFIWPDFETHARAWLEQGVFTFPAPMAAYNVVCWALAHVIVGWLGVAIGGRREVAWALAAVIALYLCAVHLVLYWSNFPWWYNFGVALLAAPAVLLGGKVAGRFVRPKAAAAM
ncbi:MAG TPA: hypothetical protein VF405_08210 [Gammaproteobacteria bacterium]